ncbi:MAG: hypothetical protein P4L83_18415 [Nevskia sp.]|nr:hypothetical protein [Nevskia sp.]
MSASSGGRLLAAFLHPPMRVRTAALAAAMTVLAGCGSSGTASPVPATVQEVDCSSGADAQTVIDSLVPSAQVVETRQRAADQSAHDSRI